MPIDSPPNKYISNKRLSSISYSDKLFYFHVKRLNANILIAVGLPIKENIIRWPPTSLVAI